MPKLDIPPEGPELTWHTMRDWLYKLWLNVKGLTFGADSSTYSSAILSTVGQSDPGQLTLSSPWGPVAVVGSVAQLRMLPKGYYAAAMTLGYYGIDRASSGFYVQNTADNTSSDNGGTKIVALDGARWDLQWQWSVSVLLFGAKADAGITDNSTVLANVRAWVAANPVQNAVIFPAGTYGYSVSPNWGIQNSNIQGIGEVHLQYSGTGNAVIIDGTGAAHGGVYDQTFYNFTIDAPSTALHGALVKNSHHGVFKLKVRGAGSSSAGIAVDGCVVSRFDNCEVSPNPDGGWYSGSMPQYGIYCRGSVGAQASYNTFLNPICEGLAKTTTGAGIYLEGSFGNQFHGGTAEGCTSGIVTATAANGCIDNKFFGIDLESNTTYDVYDQGHGNEYYSINSTLNITLTGGAHRPQFFGGRVLNIAVSSGVIGALFEGVVYNRDDIVGTGTFSIGDNSARIRDCYDEKNGAPGPFPQGAVTVGASPFTYTNTHGRDVQLAVAGGSGLALTLTRSGIGNGMAQVVGLFNLSPGDQLTITYTIAPSVWEYVR